MKHYSPFLFVSAILLCAPPACMDQSDECVCTQVFVSYTAHIQTRNGTPVDSLATWTRDKSTTQILRADTVKSGLLHPTGEYLILSDGEKKFFSPSLKTVVFHAENSSFSVEREYRFYVDDCGCHLLKHDGPDTIVMN
jgi:hypothetical protein